MDYLVQGCLRASTSWAFSDSLFDLQNIPPEIKDTPEAQALAAEKLKNMGRVTKNEWIMIATMLLAVSLWIFG